ncbi:MAG: hypothetical protein WD554_07790 [Flavobacteriaceae bacterium]
MKFFCKWRLFASGSLLTAAPLNKKLQVFNKTPFPITINPVQVFSVMTPIRI